jgi:hypothetical protein
MAEARVEAYREQQQISVNVAFRGGSVVDAAVVTKSCAKCVGKWATQHCTAISASMQPTTMTTSTPTPPPHAKMSLPTGTPTRA